MPAPPLGTATAPGVTSALPVPGSVCLLDMPGLSIDIDTQGSFVDATLTVPAGPLVLELQQRAHDMTDRRGASLR